MDVLLSRTCAVVAAAAIAASGCSHVGVGKPVKASDPVGRPAPVMTASALESLALAPSEVDTIVGASGLVIRYSEATMRDTSGTLDKVDCVGALYAAEQLAYENSGWSDVVDQQLREPGANFEHWVEQALVLFLSVDQASNFFHNLRDTWKHCEQMRLSVIDDDGTRRWRLGVVDNPSDSLITIDTLDESASDWGCQRAVGLVSNLIVDVDSCSSSSTDQSARLVHRVIDRAATQ